ncbi:MAG: response regulator transcription factor [Gammaproteobacteria bacterium]|nr:response regulator transcription factor [Gammaproteobacteria bacterium]
MAVRIALVEDVARLRQRFTERFRYFDDIELVLVAGDGETALSRIDEMPPETQPQIVLMDIEMPGLSGIETTACLRDQHPAIEVIMLTVFENEAKIFASIQAGASGYLLKDASADAIVGAILELQRGGAPMSPAVARRVMRFVRSTKSSPSDEPESTSSAPDLTEREREILQHLATDETEAQIADRLFISPHTVRTRTSRTSTKRCTSTRGPRRCESVFSSACWAISGQRRLLRRHPQKAG